MVDLVVYIDFYGKREAHRLNIDEVSGMTLGYKLLATLEQHKRVNSLLFFTGTPHRGKDYGFVSLLSLLRPDLFSPRQTLEAAFDHLPSVMLRNNKQKVTDMQGRPLFPPVHIHKEEYAYTTEEFAFYERLTEFILSGRTYARERHAAQQRVLTFVLLTLQKLASSSLAAIRRALQKRITFCSHRRKNWPPREPLGYLLRWRKLWKAMKTARKIWQRNSR